MKSKYIKSNVQENNFAINSEAYPNCYHYVTDNAISTIIPRAYFTSSGSHQNLGKEWGYYISTVPEFEGTFISRVLIFDLIQIRSYNTREDQIKIKIVEHSNYKFLTTDNVILSYGDNNFCLGNPILESNIQYVAGTDNQNLKYHLNPGDKRYSSKDDKGFAFGNADVIYIGQGKNSDNKANVAKSIVNFSSTTIASIASTYLHLNLASSIAVEEAVSLLSDAFFDALYPKLYANTETTFNNKKKVVSFIRNPYDNFSTAGQQNNLLKHTLFRFQSYNGNDEKTKLKEIKANRQTPLLYKDDSDSINYRQEILSSELDDSYTAIVDHKLSIDVFNDDSIFFWKPDPSFLAQQSISWGYLIGKNVHVAKQIFNPGSKAIYAVFGTKFDQTIDFCPNESCYYNLLLLDAAPGTRIVIDGLCTITFSSKTYTNAWNETIVGAFQNNFESTVFLEKNKRYVLHVLRLESNFQYFGTAKFNILKQGKNNLKLSDCSFKDSNLSFFSSSINYNKISISYTIIPDEDTLITVSINSIDNCDPFLEILDSNFDLIVSNDDGGGNRDSALRIRLIKGQPIIIVTRLFSQNQTGKFNLNIFKGNYFPNISNQASGTKEHLLIDFSQACHLFYQFSLNNNSSVKIDSSHFPDTNYSVIIRNSSFLYLSEIDYENPNTSLTIGNNEILIFEIVIRTPIAKNFSLEITV